MDELRISETEVVLFFRATRSVEAAFLHTYDEMQSQLAAYGDVAIKLQYSADKEGYYLRFSFADSDIAFRAFQSSDYGVAAHAFLNGTPFWYVPTTARLPGDLVNVTRERIEDE